MDEGTAPEDGVGRARGAPERASYEDGYRRNAPASPRDEAYVDGYVEGGFARLEEEQPGISEAMAYEFTAAKFSPDDIVSWLRSDPKARFYGESEEFRPG